MRREPTRAEARMWEWLRDRRFDGVKFRRQVPIGRYVVDFFSSEIHLAIEMDGSQHAAHWMVDYESERSLFLQEQGVRILRIPNELLIRDPILVQEQIAAAIRECGR